MPTKYIAATGNVSGGVKKGRIKKVIATGSGGAGTVTFKSGGASGTTVLILRVISGDTINTGRINVPFYGTLHVTIAASEVSVEYI